MALMNCPECGEKISDQSKVCVHCGYQLKDEPMSPTSEISTDDTQHAGISKEKKKKTPLIITIIAVVIVLAVIVVVALGGSKKDFNDMYGDWADKSWCTIGSDGAYMKIKTKSVNSEAFKAIGAINKDLGFSDALMDKILATSALHGRQTDYTDQYTITWTYHPDTGLEVIYEFKE